MEGAARGACGVRCPNAAAALGSLLLMGRWDCRGRWPGAGCRGGSGSRGMPGRCSSWLWQRAREGVSPKRQLEGTLSLRELALLTQRPTRSGNWMCCPPWKSAASSAASPALPAQSARLAYRPAFLAAFLPCIFKTKHGCGEGAGARSLARAQGVAAPCCSLQGSGLRCACAQISQSPAFHQLLSLACSSFSAPFLYDLPLKIQVTPPALPSSSHGAAFPSSWCSGQVLPGWTPASKTESYFIKNPRK